MKHRMCVETGLGITTVEELDNKWTGDIEFDAFLKEIMSDCIDKYFKEYQGCDFKIAIDQDNQLTLSMGIEPSYQYEHLKIIAICTDKDYSYICNGIAWGAWGSNIVKSIKEYGDYKLESKFTKFINRWHEALCVNYENWMERKDAP